MEKNVNKTSLSQQNEENSFSKPVFLDSDIKELFNKYDKNLIRIFIDTLSISLKKIAILVERLAESKTKIDCMVELDKIFQSANYMGISWIANLITEMKNFISKTFAENQNEDIQLKSHLENHIVKLKKIIHYWEGLQDFPVIDHKKDDGNTLMRFSKEDEALITMYTDMLGEYLHRIYSTIILLKTEQNRSENLMILKNTFTRLSISTNFMNYLELSAVINQGLFTLDGYIDHDVLSGVNKIIKTYNTLLNNVKIQFSGGQKQWDKYKEISPLY